MSKPVTTRLQEAAMNLRDPGRHIERRKLAALIEEAIAALQDADDKEIASHLGRAS